MKAIPCITIALVSLGHGFFSTGTAHAAVITSSSDLAPTQAVIFSAVPTAGLTNLSWNGPTNSPRDIGVSFKASANTTFNRVTMRLSPAPVYTPQSEFRLSVYETNAFNATPVGLDPIYTSLGTLPVSMSLAEPYLTFTLDQEVSIQTGKYYVIAYSFTGSTGTNSIGFAYGDSITNPTTDSQLWHGDIEGGMTRNGSSQFNFYVQQIPESSSLVFMGLGGLLLTAVANRRFRRLRGGSL